MARATTWMEVLRRYQATLGGSAYLNGYRRNDLDVLIAVPGPEIRMVEGTLEAFGFQRNQVDPATCDVNVVSSYRCGVWDIQIMTPAAWAAKRNALRKIKRGRLHVGKSKSELYRLYEQMYRAKEAQ